MTRAGNGGGARWGQLALVAFAIALSQACTFDPAVPSARVLCKTNNDCPVNYNCEPIEQASVPVSICCKDRGCASRLRPEERQRLENAASNLGDGAAGADAPTDDGGLADAPPGCGNGSVEQGETCDPPSSCPQSCPQQGCETFTLMGSAGQCNARCVSSGQQSACQSGDKCCPAVCTSEADSDCSCPCGNSQVETVCGETCNPLASCPTACPPSGCMLRKLANAGTCRAACVDDQLQTACVGGDGCCPAGCDAANDKDCQVKCGNGALEPGESCDPPATCPTTCPAIGCTLQKLEGTPDACTARCVDAGKQMACASGDSCCPAGCTTTNDRDCSCVCGNSTVEATCGETCDPLASCPTACPAQGCQLRKLVNGGGCQAQCVNDRLQTTCMGGDGCCPPMCNATNDSDCTPRCNNGAVESGETCDPPSSCPVTCPWMGCTRRKLTGQASACTAACTGDGTQTACAHGDGCCPPTCNSTNDNDCTPSCGNGVVETGEKCDGNCPTACPNVGCQKRKLVGTMCTAECVNDTLITTCTASDGCCASGCTSVNDNDCSCQCGNGVVETACGEKCDGNCPASCPPVGCQLRTLQGTACTRQCVNGAMETMCKNGDSCCPPGCNAGNDNDCVAVCSGTSDGFCPGTCTPCGATCSGSTQDIDCKLANGAACSANLQCSNACIDGHCCGSTCTACYACTGTGGTCVAILPTMEDNVPAGACAGTSSCDGQGNCKKDNGQTCGVNGECTSGNCVDGYCCNGPCNLACDRCNRSGGLGFCMTATVGTPPSPSCGTPYACNGSTAGCPAATCSTNANCLSGYTCQGTTCQVCKFADESCGNDSMCCSGDCFSFRCR